MTASEWLKTKGNSLPQAFGEFHLIVINDYAEYYHKAQVEASMVIDIKLNYADIEAAMNKPAITEQAVIVTAKWPDCIYEVGDVLHRVGSFYIDPNKPDKPGIHWQDVEGNIVNFEVVST